jgi:hypothetical protein
MGNLCFPTRHHFLSAQDSPVAPITSALKTKLYAEIEKYSSQRKDESEKLTKMRSGIENLLIQKNLHSEEKNLRTRKFKRIQLFLLNEISMLQSEKRILLNQNDALKSLKIHYEVEAVITDADRKIFDQYSQFILIKVNTINQSIRAREALLNRIYLTLNIENSDKNRWYLIGPGVGIILLIFMSLKFLQM